MSLIAYAGPGSMLKAPKIAKERRSAEDYPDEASSFDEGGADLDAGGPEIDLDASDTGAGDWPGEGDEASGADAVGGPEDGYGRDDFPPDGEPEIDRSVHSSSRRSPSVPKLPLPGAFARLAVVQGKLAGKKSR